MNDLLSVIVPVFNDEEYLDRCIDSIFEQSYENIELLLIDDGSVDCSPELCDQIAARDANVLVVHKNNQGAFFARKTGAEIANGDFIGFVDGDDTIDQCMFETLIKNAKQYDADISHCGLKIIRENGNVKCFYGTEKIIVQDHEQGITDLLCGEMIEPTVCTKIYKKELFNSFSCDYDKTFKNYEDLFLNGLMFFKAKKSVFVDKCFYNYIKHQGSMSTIKSSAHITDPVDVHKLLCDLFKNEAEKVRIVAVVAYMRSLIMSFQMIKSEKFNFLYSTAEEYRNILKQLRSYSKYLDKNSKIKYILTVGMPWLLPVAERVYGLMHGKRKYE